MVATTNNEVLERARTACIKMLMGRVLSDRYRITQEAFQYQGEDVSGLYPLQQSLVIASYAKKCRCVGYYRIDIE